MSFSAKINALLKENGMTKAALAKKSGIPYTTLDSMLKRDSDTARLEAIFRIASALGTSVEDLVFDDSEGENGSVLSSEQQRILKLYSILDSRGKDTVLSILEREAGHTENKAERHRLPVYEAPAAAGVGLPVDSDETKDLPYRAGEVPSGTEFAIRIAGDSMEPLLSDGDLVYLARRGEIRSGEIGVFLLNGESLCKRFETRDGETYLISLNPNYAPIHVLDSDDLKLVGTVVM